MTTSKGKTQSFPRIARTPALRCTSLASSHMYMHFISSLTRSSRPFACVLRIVVDQRIAHLIDNSRRRLSLQSCPSAHEHIARNQRRDSRNVASMTDTSVAVVSSPAKAHQSFTTIPAPMTSDPRLTVPATSGTCSREDSSSSSARVVFGWTSPPWGQHDSDT